MPLPIHQILSRTGRSFLVEHGGALTLVDTGWRGSEKRILRALEKVGKKPDDIEQIVITHAHGDHSGTAKRMRELTDAPIVASAEDAAVMSGKEPYAYAPRAWARVSYGFLAGYDRFEVDQPAQGKTEVAGGLVLIPAPGHTKGHVSVFAPELNALFCGDSVWNLGMLRLSWKPFTQDPAQNVETVRELADLSAQSLYFGHGGPVRRDGRDRLRSLI